MGNQVYANGMEVSCKAADGKSICAFPDVCMTPPQSPATPPGVPIPYPNTGFASDTSDGSTTVKISGQEVMLKNKSYFKKSTGDEAGCAPMKGVVTHKITGKVYFTAWSMDVKVEGENVVRMMDMTTHNHGSSPGNTIPWLYTDEMDVSQIPTGCKKQANEFNTACKGCVKNHPNGAMNLAGTNSAMCTDAACKKARECVLTPYNMGCCDGKTPHHVVPKSQFKLRGASTYTLPAGGSYDPDPAPCICAEGHSHSTGKHGDIHTETNNLTVNHESVTDSVSETGKSIDSKARWTASEAEKVGAKAVEETTGCKPAKCIEDQLRKGHENMGISANSSIRPTTAGSVTDPPGGDSTGI
ncbi:PAAR-like domain-containing protein [uncultured Sphaerotilus sp.]|uniref:PAAR-like domain-containing protein n=1 Tax=uncultured Sphaerotilus sp. TaxID=474984 RepID=UPI0030CA20D6